MERLPPLRDLLDDGTLPMQIGCTICPELGICGGLRVRAAMFDCRALCGCYRGKRCSGLCRRDMRTFAARVREVGTFSLHNVPRVSPVPGPSEDQFVPIVYDGTSRASVLATQVVALPLLRLFNRLSGTIRFSTRDGLLREFKLSNDTRVILTGVDNDQAIETWWSFRDRPRLLDGLRALGVSLITVPNYSLPLDVTRHDNLHNIKRIALAWAETIAAGLPCALHLNARTETDYRRWTDFVGERNEVTDVAFEFTTGAASTRGGYHRDQLIALAERVRRPLNLYVRGGSRYFPDFSRVFGSISVLDATPYMKTKYRQLGSHADNGVTWRPYPTAKGAPLDSLLIRNIEAVRLSTMNRIGSART